MRAIVVPAINASTSVRARRQLALAARMGDQVQIDCADGRFVRRRTLGPNATGSLLGRPGIELHLMVNEPHRWLPVAIRLGAKRVAFHVESLPDPRPLIAALRVHRIAPIAAANPRTPLKRLLLLRSMVAGFLLMGVDPGPSGARFHPDTFRRVRTLHRRFPRFEITVHGGVDADTRSELSAAGATRLTVGSAIFNSPDPLLAYRTLTRL